MTRTSQISALRRTIDCLPRQTRMAMLMGIANNTIVVGAYSTDDGVCPMLAAHRNGGRTNFVAFARAWDEYCFRGVRRRRRKPRLASPSELAALRSHIEASLLAEEDVDLGRALAEHHDLVRASEARRREAVTRQTLRPVELPIRRRAAAPAPAPASADAVPADVAVPGPARVRPGDPDRSRELGHRHGWRWLRIMRSYDEYEQAMASLAVDGETGPAADADAADATLAESR